eukprot:362943-Amphidinium_carterae.1
MGVKTLMTTVCEKHQQFVKGTSACATLPSWQANKKKSMSEAGSCACLCNIVTRARDGHQNKY